MPTSVEEGRSGAHRASPAGLRGAGGAGFWATSAGRRCIYAYGSVATNTQSAPQPAGGMVGDPVEGPARRFTHTHARPLLASGAPR